MPDMDAYWAQRAKQQSAQVKKVDLSTIPTLSDVYAANQAEHQAEEQRRREEIANSPYAWHGQGMALPPGSKFAPTKDELINGRKGTK